MFEKSGDQAVADFALVIQTQAGWSKKTFLSVLEDNGVSKVLY